MDTPLGAPVVDEEIGALAASPTAIKPLLSSTPSSACVLTKPQPGGHPVWFSTLVALACGTLFGFVLHKADVYRASVIVDQFVFANFRMLKVRAGR